MQRVRATGTLDSLPPAALSHSAQDFSVARRGGFIDPRNRTDFGSTKRDCESAVSPSSQETQRINASHSQTAISEAAKSNIGVCKFDDRKSVRRNPRRVSSTLQVDEVQVTSK